MLVEEMLPWLAQIAAVMRVRDVTNFVSIGQRCGDAVAAMGAVAPERCLAIPGDAAGAGPGGDEHLRHRVRPGRARAPWRLGRSQLRWLEAGAWGIPFVGDPRIYPSIEDGVTGFHASDPIDDRARDPAPRRRPAAARGRRRARQARASRSATRWRRWRRSGSARSSRSRGMKVGWLADSFEVAGRRRADAGGVPRRGARGRRGRRRAARRARRGSPAATAPASTTASPIRRPRRSPRSTGKPVLRYWHDLARDGRRRAIRRSTAGRPSTRRASSPRRCTATASRTASAARAT